jgi:PPM family protein phosphatase
LQAVRDGQSLPVGLYVVADGMGGHSAGEVASACAIDTLAGLLLRKALAPGFEGDGQVATPDYGALLTEGCQAANAAVFERARQAHTDMGTTLVAALIAGDQAWVANIGDSRAYQVSGPGIRQITLDHSWVARLVAAGKLTPEQARTNPERNLIYRTVGQSPQVEVDLYRPAVAQGDALVLCSDGLHTLVAESAIRDVVLAATDPQAASVQLVELANQAGGNDNISVIVVRAV